MPPYQLWKRVPGKAAIGGIGERVSQCRQFPIEDRDYARLLRMKDQISDSKIAVADRRLIGSRQVCPQPVSEHLDLADLSSWRAPIASSSA